MALTKCPECSGTISTEAEKCPHCGAARKKKTSAVTWAVLWLIVAGILSSLIVPSATQEQAATTAPAAPSFDVSEKTIAARLALMQKSMDIGVLEKAEPHGSTVRVWINPAFYRLDFQTKQNLISAVYGYYFRSDGGQVRLIDNQSGETAGSFSITMGLKMG